MFHVAKTILYRDEDCAGVIQEAIVRAFSKRFSLKSDRYAKTWLIRGRNELRSMLEDSEEN